MGRKTFNSLPNGPLKNRINIVLSRNHTNNINTQNENNEVIFVNTDNIFTILKKYKKDNKKIFIIGGSDIYKLFIDRCNILHITIIYQQINGDCLFPYDIKYLMNNYKITNESNLLFSKNNNTPYKYITFETETKNI